MSKIELPTPEAMADERYFETSDSGVDRGKTRDS